MMKQRRGKRGEIPHTDSTLGVMEQLGERRRIQTLAVSMEPDGRKKR